jgi:hypothetical protein
LSAATDSRRATTPKTRSASSKKKASKAQPTKKTTKATKNKKTPAKSHESDSDWSSITPSGSETGESEGGSDDGRPRPADTRKTSRWGRRSPKRNEGTEEGTDDPELVDTDLSLAIEEQLINMGFFDSNELEMAGRPPPVEDHGEEELEYSPTVIAQQGKTHSPTQCHPHSSSTAYMCSASGLHGVCTH